jgi:hypothetical protein
VALVGDGKLSRCRRRTSLARSACCAVMDGIVAIVCCEGPGEPPPRPLLREVESPRPREIECLRPREVVGPLEYGFPRAPRAGVDMYEGG